VNRLAEPNRCSPKCAKPRDSGFFYRQSFIGQEDCE
jgi:hypothetical protein